MGPRPRLSRCLVWHLVGRIDDVSIPAAKRQIDYLRRAAAANEAKDSLSRASIFE